MNELIRIRISIASILIIRVVLKLGLSRVFLYLDLLINTYVCTICKVKMECYIEIKIFIIIYTCAQSEKLR